MTKDEKAQLVTAQRYLKSAVDYFSCGRVAQGVACVENVDVLVDVLLSISSKKPNRKSPKDNQ
ncbi:hypothetical protein [Rosenbergiella metrosideri]|uniref:hypothetical protein n=1 Tax=Rosenbergiella metrosideri TaxID=2921185 RepID=UPI001F501877|nr:hypothetical protein [Rosenbergiella metrosideri]